MSRDDRAEPLFPFLRSMPKSVVDLVSEKAEALVGSPSDFDSLVDLVGDARFVLLGEASHGRRIVAAAVFAAVAETNPAHQPVDRSPRDDDRQR